MIHFPYLGHFSLNGPPGVCLFAPKGPQQISPGQSAALGGRIEKPDARKGRNNLIPHVPFIKIDAVASKQFP